MERELQQFGFNRKRSRISGMMWDVLIAGAGPAGSVLGAILARRGWRVLIVEKSAWPRDKVCGGCLSSTAVDLLNQYGLAPDRNQATPLNHYILVRGRKRLVLNDTNGIALSRRDLDAHLIQRAINAGATFLPQVGATLLPAQLDQPHRRITLHIHPTFMVVSARIVIACDGIQGNFLRREPWARWHIDPHAWIGLAATVDQNQYQPEINAVAMHVGRRGFAGAVAFPDGAVRIAAAVDPKYLRDAGSPAAAVANVLQMPDNFSARFSGTGLLTRYRDSLGDYRVLLAGDACGYVESFTGQGIEWAIRNAIELADLLPEPSAPWPADLPVVYTQRLHKTVGVNQRLCRGVSYVLHHPLMSAAALRIADYCPWLAKWAACRCL